MMGFAYFAYSNNEKGKTAMAFLYGGLALLFQPFFKITLGRDVWNVIDMIVGTTLVVFVIQSLKKEKSSR